MINEIMQDQYEEGDYILCIGNPVLIGWAVAIAASFSDSGQVRCLHWSSRERAYTCIAQDIFQDLP